MIAAWSALLRLARRDARRNPGRALLVLALIAVPVAGVVAATVLFSTIRPTPAELMRQALGAADLAAYTADADARPAPVGCRPGRSSNRCGVAS